MQDVIVGICRFSFVGQCDWVDTRGRNGGDPNLLASRIPKLYDPQRLERRFEAFEKLCLPSLKAQTDPEFSLWFLTSPEMPTPWLERLHDLCAGLPQSRIIVSAKRKPCDALAEPLVEAAAAAGRPVIQFRIDDDDALSRHHIARLRHHAQRFSDMSAFGISFPRGLLINSYDGQPLTHWRVHQAFVGAGAALRMRAPWRSMFALNHPSIPRHFPAFTDMQNFGYIQTRWDQGDSAVNKREATMPRGFDQISPERFQALLAEDFPFLAGTDLEFIRQAG